MNAQTQPADNLVRLNAIPAYAKRIFQGQFYSIKLRVSKEAHAQNVARMKARYPGELIVHNNRQNDFIIFGGTFNQKSEFINDLKRIMNITIK